MATKRRTQRAKRSGTRRATGATRAKATRRAPKSITLRLDLWVEAQAEVVRHVGRFFADAADMTVKGNYSPAQWLQRYATMWSDLASDLGALGKR